MEKYEIKVFISQPMTKPDKDDVLKLREKTKECIINNRELVASIFNIDTDDKSIDIKFVSTYERIAPDNAPKLYYLGEAIKDLGETDLVVFCDGWESARGCVVEKVVVDTFKIPYIETRLINEEVSILHLVKYTKGGSLWKQKITSK